MTLASGLAIAVGGLANIDRHLALLAHNVSNSSTPGYVREVAVQTALTASGIGIGVKSGPAIRDVDITLQNDLWTHTTAVADLNVRQTALSAIDALNGAPGSGDDLSSRLAAVRDAFSQLGENPADQTNQRSVVNSALTLAETIKNTSKTYQQQRQIAQDGARDDVLLLNSALSQVGNLSNQIVRLKNSGQSIADLENQRDSIVRQIASLVDVKVLNQSNGDIRLITTSGLFLPTNGKEFPFSLRNSNLQPDAWYPDGGVPGIMLGGVDVSKQFSTGRIAANLALRDAVLPVYQAALDELSETITQRFNVQGLALFTDPAGNIPATDGIPTQSGYVGYSSTIQVNPLIVENAALVRDGTHAIVASPTGPADFTPNPTDGPAGFTNMIKRVLDHVFGQGAQPNVQYQKINIADLGPNGDLNLSFYESGTLIKFATDLVASQSADIGFITDKQYTATAIQSALQARFDEKTGVDVDSEMALMVQLQNAYAANARVIATVQAMWDQLLGAVR